MPLSEMLLIGPLNGGLLLLWFLTALGVVGWALRRVHRGESVPLVPLALLFVLPLGFAAWASTWQHTSAMDWATTHPRPEYRQTYMAAMMERTVLTQFFAGIAVTVSGLALVAGSVLLTVRGERPRWLAGGVASTLGVVMLAIAAASVSEYPGVLVGARIALYTVAIGVTVAAVVLAHRRGPGVQLAAIAGVTLPLVVVGVDLITMSYVTFVRLVEIAVAVPAEKQALMYRALQVLDQLQTTSFVTLGLALALALLGPVLAWRRDRPLAAWTLAAVAAVVLVAGVGLSTTMTWSAPFR